MRTLQCEHCGAPLQKLNTRCQYCNTWNRDPQDPQDPPAPAVAAPPPAKPVAQEPAPAPAEAPAQVEAPAPAKVEAPAPAPAPAPAAAPAASATAAPDAPAEPARVGRVPRETSEDDASEHRIASKPTKPVVKRGEPVAPAKPVVKHAEPVVAGPRRAAADAIGAGSKTAVVRRVVAEHGVEEEWSRGRAVRASRPSRPTETEHSDLARIEAVAAAVYYVATADDEDEMDDDEYEALVEALGEMLGDDVDSDEFDENLAEWDDAIDGDDARFLRDIARTLGDDRMRRHALDLAVTVACADGELSGDEEDAAYDLAEALGFDDADAERIIERATERATDD